MGYDVVRQDVPCKFTNDVVEEWIVQDPPLLAVWSTMVDDFVVIDATEDEIGDYFAEKAARHAREGWERRLKSGCPKIESAAKYVAERSG